MTDPSPQDAEKPSDDDVGRRDSSIRDEGERRWAYFVVKVFVLVVVAGCLLGANEVGVASGNPGSLINTLGTEHSDFLISFGWPFEYNFVYIIIPYPHPHVERPPLCLFAHERLGKINYRILSLNIIIALVILLYLAHAINVIHRRLKPTYQLSVRFVVLVLPILVGGGMALWHYGLVSWRGCFLVPVYGGMMVCLICFGYEVLSFVRKRKQADA